MFKETVARHEPKTTVTTKSKAFIFDSVRLPDIRKINTRHIYASIVITKVLMMLSQLSKNMFFMFLCFVLIIQINVPPVFYHVHKCHL